VDPFSALQIRCIWLTVNAQAETSLTSVSGVQRTRPEKEAKKIGGSFTRAAPIDKSFDFDPRNIGATLRTLRMLSFTLFEQCLVDVDTLKMTMDSC
jgi:hypothetical protein